MSETLPVLDWTHGESGPTYDIPGGCLTCGQRFIVRRRKGIKPPLSVECPSCECTEYSWRRAATPPVPAGRLMAAVRAVIADGYDAPGVHAELHAAYYEARDAAPPVPADPDAIEAARLRHVETHDEAEMCGPECAPFLAPSVPAGPHQYDHDGMARHHHDDQTGEAVWWLNCEQFGGERIEHRWATRERAEHAALRKKARAVVDALDAIRDDETEDDYADALVALRAALDEVKG